MNTETAKLVRYDVSEAQIAELRQQYAALTFDTPADYEVGRKAIATIRELRVAVEKKRQELKRESLDFGRRVDDVAKHYTALLEEIEEPLKARKQLVDDEKARIKAEKERAEREAIEAEIRRKREEEEARLRAEREAEEARLAEDRAKLEAEKAELERQRREQEERDRAAREAREASERVERERIAAEQKAEAERLAAQRAELEAQQRRQEAERRALEEAKQKAEREEFERQARARAEEEARAKLERERIAEEEAKAKEAERQAAERARLEALKPDIEKLHDFAMVLRAVRAPDLSDPLARKTVGLAMAEIGHIADALAMFDGRESAEAAAE